MKLAVHLQRNHLQHASPVTRESLRYQVVRNTNDVRFEQRIYIKPKFHCDLFEFCKEKEEKTKLFSLFVFWGDLKPIIRAK